MRDPQANLAGGLAGCGITQVRKSQSFVQAIPLHFVTGSPSLEMNECSAGILME